MVEGEVKDPLAHLMGSGERHDLPHHKNVQRHSFAIFGPGTPKSILMSQDLWRLEVKFCWSGIKTTLCPLLGDPTWILFGGQIVEGTEIELGTGKLY